VGGEVALKQQPHRVSLQPQQRLHANPHVAQLKARHHAGAACAGAAGAGRQNDGQRCVTPGGAWSPKKDAYSRHQPATSFCKCAAKPGPHLMPRYLVSSPHCASKRVTRMSFSGRNGMGPGKGEAGRHWSRHL
jgi:hypothetical protein